MNDLVDAVILRKNMFM